MKMTEKTYSRPTIPFPATEYTARLARLRRRLVTEKLDAVLVEDAVNRYYLTGFEASNGVLCVSAADEPVFLTDFRYLESARQAIPFARCARLVAGVSRYEPLAAQARRQHWRRVGVDGTAGGAPQASRNQTLPAVTAWTSCQESLNRLRQVKSPRELAALRRAIAMNDRVFATALPQIRPGMTEWAIRVLLRAEMDRVSQGESFDTIVAIGTHASHCHHHPSLRPWRRGQGLLLDMGVKVDGYCADMTRVVFYGPPSPRLREIYQVVLAANRRAIAGVRAGLSGDAADRLARQVIEKAGYGRYFGHGLGHGLGLQVHDPGSLRPKGEERLAEGMVVTIEPGIYLPGVGGVRIEDVVVLRRHGCELLTRTPKELLVL
jgi:Xaa-Pro aminopeptidase